MGTKKSAKKEAPLPDGWSRAPRPLPATCTGDAARDAEGDVVALLAGDALDVGDQRWSDDFAEKLTSKDRRGYSSAFDRSSSARREREAWLAALMKAAARSVEGRARLVAIVAVGAQPPVRALAASALLATHPGDDELRAIGTLLDMEGTTQERRLGARAILQRNATEAYEALAPYAEDDAIVFAVSELAPRVDPRWSARLLAMLGAADQRTQYSAMMALERLEKDASGPRPDLYEAVARHFAGLPESLTFMAEQAFVLLGRSEDARAVPYLARALELRNNYWNLVLEALRRVKEPVAVHAIHRWVDDATARGYEATWEGFRLAGAVIAELEALGPVPPEAPKAPPPAKAREQRKLHRVKKLALPEAQTSAQQRLDLVALLASVGLDGRAEALIRPAVEIFAQRTDEARLEVGASRFGGRPDLPRGQAWPKRGADYLGFIGQVRLEDVAALDPRGLLPKAGLLSFFVMDESEGYLEHALVLHVDDTKHLARLDVPQGFDRRPREHVLREPYAACALTLRPLLELPSPGHTDLEKTLTKAEATRYRDLEIYAGEHNQLLGWRDQGYDETSVDDEVLLQVKSDDHACFEWGDVETLALMVPREALAARDFAKVYPKVGD